MDSMDNLPHGPAGGGVGMIGTDIVVPHNPVKHPQIDGAPPHTQPPTMLAPPPHTQRPTMPMPFGDETPSSRGVGEGAPVSRQQCATRHSHDSSEYTPIGSYRLNRVPLMSHASTLSTSQASLKSGGLSKSSTLPKAGRMAPIGRGSIQVRSDLLPAKLSDINDQFARDRYEYANHLNKKHPKENPTPADIQSYVHTLGDVFTYVNNRAYERRLEVAQALSRKHELPTLVKDGKNVEGCDETGKTLDGIHLAALNPKDKAFSEEYLKRVLEFIIVPQKYDKEWIGLVIKDVENKYDIVVAYSKQNFVDKIAQKRFNDKLQLMMRRQMAKYGSVWYQRLPKGERLGTVFGEGVLVDIEKKTVWVGRHEIKGFLVTKKGPSSTQGDEGVEASRLEWTGRKAAFDEAKVREVIETSADDQEALVQNVMGLLRAGQKVRVTRCKQWPLFFCCILFLTRNICLVFFFQDEREEIDHTLTKAEDDGASTEAALSFCGGLEKSQGEDGSLFGRGDNESPIFEDVYEDVFPPSNEEKEELAAKKMCPPRPPAPGTYVGSMSYWKDLNWGKMTPCGKYIDRQGRLFHSFEQANSMNAVRTKQHFQVCASC